MLLGQGLGGRHQRRLVARLDRPQHREQRPAPSCRFRPRPSAAAASAGRSARSPSISSIAAPLVAGELERQRVEPARDQLPGAPEGERRADSPRRPWRRAASAAWCRKSSSKASRSRASSASREADRGSARRRGHRPPHASRRRARSSAGSGSIAWRASGRAPATPNRESASAPAPRWPDGPGTIPVVWPDAASPPSTNSCSRRPETASPARACLRAAAAGSPRARRSASHAWLNQTAVAGPLRSATAASTIRKPAPAGRPHARRPHLDLHRGLLAGPQARPARDLAAIAVAVRDVEQEVADGRDAELLGGRRQPRPGPAQGADRSARAGWAGAATAAERARRSSGASAWPDPSARLTARSAAPGPSGVRAGDARVTDRWHG